MKRLSFSSHQRLQKRREYLSAYEFGKKKHTQNFIVFCKAQEESEGLARLGIAVSKKNGNAVLRNRLKRLVREFFRLNQESFGQSFDFVVIPKRHLAIKKISLAVVEQELFPVFAKKVRRTQT